MSSSTHSSQRVSVYSLVFIGFWLAALLAIAIWFQSGYFKSFAGEEQTFLIPDQTQEWFNTLQPLLPEKQRQYRMVQFWQPDCICNRFARPHALDALSLSQALNVEHITVIPARFAHKKESLQALNPKTTIVMLDPTTLEQRPNSPSVILEGQLGQIRYFGPLGFGAFCSQASTSIIERQLSGIANPSAQPYFNVVGQGCFCSWE